MLLANRFTHILILTVVGSNNLQISIIINQRKNLFVRLI